MNGLELKGRIGHIKKELKLLLYCSKSKSVLRKLDNYFLDKHNDNYYWEKGQTVPYSLNGKIVAECDFEVEEINYSYLDNPFDDFYGMQLHTKTLKESKILQCSKLNSYELRKYLLRTEDDYIGLLEVGYAIHIKNLHIFDKPKELSDYYRYLKVYNNYGRIEVAPQNMMYAYEVVPCKEEHLFRGVLQEFRWNRYNEYILISIQPQWLCKILNGEKTIEVRKKVLKEMLK